MAVWTVVRGLIWSVVAFVGVVVPVRLPPVDEEEMEERSSFSAERPTARRIRSLRAIMLLDELYVWWFLKGIQAGSQPVLSVSALTCKYNSFW
jgi:hypothetical protein